MTPERLEFIIRHCFRLRRKASLSAHYIDIARFLHVTPITLRRWLSGERPIPRSVEIIFEIFHSWPEIDAPTVDQLIAARDRTAGRTESAELVRNGAKGSTARSASPRRA